MKSCEVCGGSHVHGGGLVGQDPREMLGGRAPHCCFDARRQPIMQYEIVDGAPSETARLLQEAGR